MVKSHFGPLVLIVGKPTQDDLKLAAEITAKFGKGGNAEVVEVQIHPLNSKPYKLKVTPLPAEQVLREWYI